jgi:hypothetical protein
VSIDLNPTTVHAGADPGDHDRFSHYVNKAKSTESRVLGIPIKALCGKTWVPSRDPERYPVCPDCLRLYEAGWRIDADGNLARLS